MKKLKSILSILVLVASCNNPTQIVEITPDLQISIPQKSEIKTKENGYSQKKWEISFDDDHFSVLKYSINENDSANTPDRKKAFIKNIDAFIQVFNLKNLDSTFTDKDKFLQSDVSFDYLSNGDNYKFYGRFLVIKQDFIAFCFHTPLPVDNYSKRTKDKLFKSIEIK
jgi:hypothetical protein